MTKKFQSNIDRKVALITGASSGIGLEIAKLFLSEGYIVLPCARRIDLLNKLFNNDEFAFPFYIDLNKINDIPSILSKIISAHGPIDILVNNAAFLTSGKVEDISIDDWVKSYAVNITSIFVCTKILLPEMKKRNFGRIINVSSGGSVNCAPNYSPYSSSKAAINAFTKSLGNELTGSNVKVNVMSPGPCKTSMFPDNPLEPKIGAPTALMLASSDENLPNGKFFWMEKEIDIFPDLSHINWADPSSSKLID